MAPTSRASGKLQQEITGSQEVKNKLGTAEPPPASQHLGAIKKRHLLLRMLDFVLPQKSHKRARQCLRSQGVALHGMKASQLYVTVLGVCTRELGHLKAVAASPLAHCPRPCPDAGQVHGPLLRLNQVSPADSGEYLCRVTSGSGTLEASVLVTIEASSPGPIPGE